MATHRGFRFRLYPTTSQEEQFSSFSGVVRLVYNLALEQRRDWWRHYERETGKPLNYVAQARELTALRAGYDWIAAVSQTCQQQALRDLDRAFQAFFAGRAGYPTPRRKGVNDAFRFQGRECRVTRLNRSWGTVFLPKIGEVRFRWTRAIQGNVQNVTVAPDALGWHVAFACEVDAVAQPAPTDTAIGVDRGIAHTLAFSDGRFSDLPMERLRLLDRRARKQARAFSRCRRDSKRREKSRRRVAATRARIARIRRHWLHVETARLARNYRLIAIEDLKVRAMSASAAGTVDAPGRNVRAKAGLNRAIMEQGWHQFEVLLSWKLTARGGVLTKIRAAYTSQTCACCGSVSPTHRKSQAVFRCSDCGQVAHADTNAAINILRAGTRPAVRAPVGGPVIREALVVAA